jgi:hypothetical protein
MVITYKLNSYGFSNEDFHLSCDNKGSTITIIHTHNGFLFGGYAPVSWNSHGEHYSHPDAFIFTLFNPHSIPPTKYLLQPQDAFAIRGHHSYCAVFGSGDITVTSNSNINNTSSAYFPSSYVDTTGRGKLTFTGTINFTCQEIEVYQVLDH